MNRLNELADAIGHVLNLNDPMTKWPLAIHDELRRMLNEASTILRSAAAETVGTEWADGEWHHAPDHNAGVNAARLRIAAVGAERDAAIVKLAEKQAAIDLGPGDMRRTPADRDLWLPWQEGDTEDDLPPLPNSSATLAGSTPADDTRELVARLANEVSWIMVHLASKDRPDEWRNTAKNIDGIIAAARKGAS